MSPFESQFRTESARFIPQLLRELHSHLGPSIERHDVDHICFRTDSEDDYQAVCREFAAFSDLLIESPVNGRVISTFKLHSPLKAASTTIDVVEVPAPKKGKVTRRGLEHIEIVIDESFDSLVSRYPEIEFDRSGENKLFNPELEISFSSGAVKFHHLSLECVIAVEKNARVMNALEKTNLLQLLRAYRPTLSGTFPLELAVADSDLDILCEAHDLEAFIQDATIHFGKFPAFSVSRTVKQNQPSAVVRFRAGDLPIEIFAQDRSVNEQQSNRHMLVESRLLKLFPEKRAEIRRMRLRGEKTEPAFAEAFNLPGDPFLALVELGGFGEAELRSRVSSLLKP